MAAPHDPSMSSLDAAIAAAKALRERVLTPLQRMFVDKDEVIEVLGVCLVAAEHAFLLGPPGTAKSAIVTELAKRLDGEVFSYLLTRFTEPSELFGPFDIRRLREGDLVTNTEGMLPEASLVFLDELLNANSAILNSLLAVLNERVFRRGREERVLPLLMVVGASNHLPEDDALGAMFDRFLMRVECTNASDERLDEVLRAGWSIERRSTVGERVEVDAIRTIQRALLDVDLDAVRPAFLDLVRGMRRAGLPVSDRRAVKLQRLVAASALLCARPAAEPSDLWVARHVWDRTEQREVIESLVGDVLGPTDGAAVHPAARHGRRPDPEELARDLEGLEAEWGEETRDEGADGGWRDRLRMLASRTEWVEDETRRGQLAAHVERLWRLADDGGAEG